MAEAEYSVKLHICEFEGCGKAFTSRTQWKRHSVIHTGEQPYICEICGKRFNQSANLTKHIKGHGREHLKWNRSTSEKTHKCTFPGCSSSFTAKSSLQSHMISAHLSEENKACKGNDRSQVTNESSKPCDVTEHLLLVTENQYLRSVVLELSEHIAKWKNKTLEEQESVMEYAASMMEEICAMPMLPPVRDGNLGTAMMDAYTEKEKEILGECCGGLGGKCLGPFMDHEHSHSHGEHSDFGSSDANSSGYDFDLFKVGCKRQAK